MCKFYLIRHGMTPGNKLSRYIGSTDEELSIEGRQALEEKVSFYNKAAEGQNGQEAQESILPEKLYVSPMKRCRQTAEILFPGMEQEIVADLREFDFGIFENKNYQELSDCREYQAWIDSYCEDPVPGGECRRDFQNRSCQAFASIVENCLRERIRCAAVVVHGGTIMSIMDAFVESEKGYYDWHVKNGEGFVVSLDSAEWNRNHKIKLCVE